MKLCGKCKQRKRTEEFPKNKRSSDGLGSWCKVCNAANSLAYSKTPLGKATRKRYFASDKGKAALKKGLDKLRNEGYFRYGQGAVSVLRHRARKRGISFSLTNTQLREWWVGTPESCAYCGVSLEDYRKLRDGVVSYEGDRWEIRRFKRFYRSSRQENIDCMTIDRVDSSLGYDLGNIVKSCWICNSLKSDFLTEEEMHALAPSLRRSLERALTTFCGTGRRHGRPSGGRELQE